MKRELLPDRRQRFALQEVAGVLVGAALGLTVRALSHAALVVQQPRLLGARELGGSEAELRDPLQLGHQGVETACHAAVGDQRQELGLVLGARRTEQRTLSAGSEKGRVLALRELVEPGVEHVTEQTVHHDVAISTDRILRPCRPQVADANRRRDGFLVGDDGVAGAGTLGHIEGRPRPHRRRIGQGRELRRDHLHGGIAIDVAHDNHGHQIRAVPVAIETRQLLALRALDHVGIADRRTAGVLRSVELDAADLVACTLSGAEVLAPLRQDDATLTLDRTRIERGALGPVLQDEQRAIEHRGRIRRHAQRVLRVVVARLRIRVRADAQAERRQELGDALSRKVTRALEQHVLDEVCQPLLVGIFQH